MEEDFTDDEPLANLIADVAFDALTKLGSDPEARYQFFRAFINLANRTVGRDSRRVQ